MKLIINSFCDTLRSLKDLTDFKKTPEFTEIFGDVALEEGLKCMPVTDVDLIFSNLILDGGWNVIDYEWTFDFPIPVDFVIYRAVFYYIKESGINGEKKELLYKTAGMTKELRAVFSEMENNFQFYIKGGRITLPEMYSIMGKDEVKLSKAVKTASLTSGSKKAKLYFDIGSGFNENETLYIDTVEEDDGTVSFSVLLPEKCISLRVDPMDRRCMLKVLKAENGGKLKDPLTNGILFAGNTIVFDTDDPQIIFEEVNAQAPFFISYRLTMLYGDMFEDIVKTLGGEKKPAYAPKLKGLKKGLARLKL
jgi:hypothetical protein